MNTILVVETIMGIVVFAGAALFGIWEVRRRRRASLQQRFGPEYEREVRARGGERAELVAADHPQVHYRALFEELVSGR